MTARSQLAILLRTRALLLGLPLLFAVLGCATTRPVDEQHDDNKVTLALGTKLAADPEIDRYRIDIDTIKGVVTLRGSVATSEQRSDAERIAGSTEGVTKVVNDLVVRVEPKSASARFEDGWIVGMINSKLALDPEVRSRNVDVDVFEGVVTLSGIVETKVARGEAEDLAHSVDGVVKVVNELVVQD
jgi:hyperosmotically inducible periplasmic protein